MLQECLLADASVVCEFGHRYFQADVESPVVVGTVQHRSTRPFPVGPDVWSIGGSAVGGRVVSSDANGVAASFQVGLRHLRHEDRRAIVPHHGEHPFQVEAAHDAAICGAPEGADDDAEVLCLFRDEQHLGLLLLQFCHHDSDVCTRAVVLQAGDLNKRFHSSM